MFASKTWYKEVIILGIVPRVIGVAAAFVLFSLLNNPSSILANIPSFLTFVGLAVWRVKVKALNVKEILVLYFVPIPLEIGLIFSPILFGNTNRNRSFVPDNRTVTCKRSKKVRSKG